MNKCFIVKEVLLLKVHITLSLIKLVYYNQNNMKLNNKNLIHIIKVKLVNAIIIATYL